MQIVWATENWLLACGVLSDFSDGRCSQPCFDEYICALRWVLLHSSLAHSPRRSRTGADNLAEAKQAYCWQVQAVGSTAVTKVCHILQAYWSILRFPFKNSLPVHLRARQQLNYGMGMGKCVQVFMKWKCVWRRFCAGWLWVPWFKLFWKASWDEHMVHGRMQQGEWSSP